MKWFWKRTPDRVKLTVNGLVFLVIGLIIGAAFGPRSPVDVPLPEMRLTVKKVIDGDTVLLSDNTLVRLLGVDTPEYGRPGFEEAKLLVEEETRGRAVRLELDPCCELDIHGRTLGYLWIGDRLLNQRLLEEELAVPDRTDQLKSDYF